MSAGWSRRSHNPLLPPPPITMSRTRRGSVRCHHCHRRRQHRGPTTWTTLPADRRRPQDPSTPPANISRIGLCARTSWPILAGHRPRPRPGWPSAHPPSSSVSRRRMSGSVVGESGLQPCAWASRSSGTMATPPLMVHVGKYAAGIRRDRRPAGDGDLPTHCFNGKPNRILTRRVNCARRCARRCNEDRCSTSATAAPASASRGWRSWPFARSCPHTISPDIHRKNWQSRGPAYSPGPRCRNSSPSA